MGGVAVVKYCPECQMPLEGMVAVCPSCHCRLTPGAAGPVVGRSGTMIESVEDLRQAARGPGTLVENINPQRSAVAHGHTPPQLQSPNKRSKTAPAISTVDSSARKGGTAQGGHDATPFRPLTRPPVLLLCVVDDGNRDDGEWIRVRSESFVIGRSEGDLIIPHDDAMSGRHAEIVRLVERGQSRYLLRDLRSTNGTFIRATRASLRQDQELLIGGRRYRFDASGAVEADAEDVAPVQSTRAWRSASIEDLQRLMPALVELTPAGDGRRIPLAENDLSLGADASQCALVIEGDPFVSPRHARIYRDERQRWMIENLKSLNGIWLRTVEVPLPANSEFQLGEQRFVVRLD